MGKRWEKRLQGKSFILADVFFWIFYSICIFSVDMFPKHHHICLLTEFNTCFHIINW